MPNQSLSTAKILIRHTASGLLLLFLPLLILNQSEIRSFSVSLAWLIDLGVLWLVWFGVIFAAAWLAYFMADRLIWPKWAEAFNIDLYADGSFISLFRKWALCWRCLGYWYGAAASFLLWILILPKWYGAFYFLFPGASFSAALTALIVTAMNRKNTDSAD